MIPNLTNIFENVLKPPTSCYSHNLPKRWTPICHANIRRISACPKPQLDGTQRWVTGILPGEKGRRPKTWNDPNGGGWLCFLCVWGGQTMIDAG